MDNLIGTLLLVLPGFGAFYFSRRFGPVSPRQITDFERTVLGLIYNIPGIMLIWAGIAIGNKSAVSFKDYSTQIQSMPSIFLYLVGSLVTSSIVAYWWEYSLSGKVDDWVNEKREQRELPRLSNKTVWESFFGNESEMFMAIYPIGEPDKKIFGLAKLSFKPGDSDKGIMLLQTGELEDWYDLFGKPLRTYFDVNQKIVYEMFPASAWEEARNRDLELVNEQATSSSQVLPIDEE